MTSCLSWPLLLPGCFRQPDCRDGWSTSRPVGPDGARRRLGHASLPSSLGQRRTPNVSPDDRCSVIGLPRGVSSSGWRFPRQKCRPIGCGCCSPSRYAVRGEPNARALIAGGMGNSFGRSIAPGDGKSAVEPLYCVTAGHRGHRLHALLGFRLPMPPGWLPGGRLLALGRTSPWLIMVAEPSRGATLFQAGARRHRLA